MAARLLKCPCCLAGCVAFLWNCCLCFSEMQETVFNPNSCENWRVFFSPFFLWGEFVTKRCGKLHMAGWSGLTMRLPYRSTRGNPTSSAQHRIWQRDPCQRPRSCFPMVCGMRTNSFATTLRFDFGGWLSLWYGDCLICFWSEKVAAFHSCCRNCPEPTETSLKNDKPSWYIFVFEIEHAATPKSSMFRIGTGIDLWFQMDFIGLFG